MKYDYSVPRHAAHAGWLLAVEAWRRFREVAGLQKGQFLDAVGEHGDIRKLAPQNDQPARVCRSIARETEEQPEIDNRQQNTAHIGDAEEGCRQPRHRGQGTQAGYRLPMVAFQRKSRLSQPENAALAAAVRLPRAGRSGQEPRATVQERKGIVEG